MSISAEITGKESPAGDGSALDALIDFYRSFNSSDLNALAANWADGEARTRGSMSLTQGTSPLIPRPTRFRWCCGSSWKVQK